MLKLDLWFPFLVMFRNLNLLRKSRKITVNGSEARNHTEASSLEL